jgi:uncharacterized protein YndB with AHSA1/START domain
MRSDPIDLARLVTREVRNAERDGTPTKVVVARRSYPTDPSDLWDAVTNQERLPRWFAPVSGDLELGGRFQVQGNAGGVVERCEEPTLFAITWEFDGGLSWVTVSLTPDGAHTVLELVHEAPVDPDSGFYDQFGPGAVGVGWDLSLMGLGLHLDSGEAVDPAAAEAWSLSPDGTAFVTEAAQGWAAGAVAAGDPPEAARAAGERTIAFYTTDPTAGAE